MAQSLVEELDTIDNQAYKMAKSIVTQQQRRDDLAQKAMQLRERFKEITTQLKTTWPDLYASRSDQISETSLDLKFVMSDQKMVSLRLNHLIQGLGAGAGRP